jgi:hypothetical protein
MKRINEIAETRVRYGYRGASVYCCDGRGGW